MGCFQSSAADASTERRSPFEMPRKRMVQTVDVVTPCTLDVDIRFPCTVRLELQAPEDKERTVEVSWLDMADQAKFEEQLKALFGTRYLPNNELSDQKWKTAVTYDRMGEALEVGTYSIVLRSSSILSDKNVKIVGTITKEEVRPGDKRRVPAAAAVSAP